MAPMDNRFLCPRSRYDADTLAFAAASGATDLRAVNDLVVYLKSQSLWDYTRFYPMKSAQNAGTGSTVYGIGGLGGESANDMVLVNSPTWGGDGITFNPIGSQFGNIGRAYNGGDLYVSIGIKRLSAPPAGDEAMFGQFSAAVNERAFVFNQRGDIAGDPFTVVRSSNGTGVDTVQSTDELQTTNRQVVTAVLQDGSFSKIYQNNVALTLSGGSVINTLNATQDCYVATFNNNGSPSTSYYDGLMFCVLVLTGTGRNPSAAQREAITNLINAL